MSHVLWSVCLAVLVAPVDCADANAKKRWTDREPVGGADSHGSQEPCDGWVCTVAPPDEYDWTIRVLGDTGFCQITLGTCLCSVLKFASESLVKSY